MRIQVLVAAMHQNNHDLVESMKISSDVIVANQTDRNCIENICKDGQTITYLNFNERGVGLNRNNALMRANSDVVVFADADEVFVDNYEEIIQKAYSEIPDADAIIFNVGTIGDSLGRRSENHIKKLHYWNIFNYGAPRITVKNNILKRNNIYFSRLFGGGAIYSAGEDTLFLYDLYKTGAKIYIHTGVIGNVRQDESSWFSGFNKKYFYDKGAVFAALSKSYGFLFCLLLLLKNRKMWFGGTISLIEGIKLAYRGFRGYEALITYNDFISKTKC